MPYVRTKLCPGLHGSEAGTGAYIVTLALTPESGKACALDEHRLKRLVGAISAARFQPFLDECCGDPVRALRLYAWNSEISGAFHGPMWQFEVTLRDGFHDRLSAF